MPASLEPVSSYETQLSMGAPQLLTLSEAWRRLTSPTEILGRTAVMTVTAKLPALFALQTDRQGVVPNAQVAAYEEALSVRLGVPLDDVQLTTSGTTTSPGDSAEDS